MADQKNDENQSKSTYFSYGPYRSENSDVPNPESTQQENILEEKSQQEEHPHMNPVREDILQTESQPTQQSRESKVSSPKKFSARWSAFAAFLAGALVVSSLMFAADKTNLFTGGAQATKSSDGALEVQGQNIVLDNSQSSDIVSDASFQVIRPNNIADIAKKASPAVVKIEAYSKVSNSRGNSLLFNDPFFRQFFGDLNEDNSNNGKLQQTGMGTGFIFEKSGYILTNEHVISGADEIRVTVEGYDKPFIAKLLGNSYDLDLAALKIEGEKEFAVLPLGDIDKSNVGDWVVAIGNPYGFEHTVTVGVLSAKERPISIPDEKGTRNYKHLLQTDASINPGNSGGPLLNLKGEVIGINTAVSTEAQGIGFAIPTSTIQSVINNLKNNIEIPKEPAPYIGVSLQDIDQSWVSDLKLENTEGALVNGVERRSPAFNAGLRPYDVILDVNSTKIKSSNDLVEKIKSSKVGEKVVIGIIRDGKRLEISVEIGDRNKAQTE